MDFWRTRLNEKKKKKREREKLKKMVSFMTPFI